MSVRPSDRFIRLSAKSAKEPPSIALDRWDRGVKPPSYLEILRSMEDWDDAVFQDPVMGDENA